MQLDILGRVSAIRNLFLVAGIALLFFWILGEGAYAAKSPFGVAVPDQSTGTNAPEFLQGFLAYVAEKQSAFYQQMIAALKAFKSRPDAAWLLVGLSFAYGIFHAAGPGHGKIVISTYLLASGETLRRGILISFAAAIVQAIVAIGLIGVAAAALNLTSIAITQTTRVFELGSYGLIIALGIWLIWQKGRALVSLIRRPRPTVSNHHPDHDHGHNHHHHDHHHEGHCSSCGHAHAPDPQQMQGPLSVSGAVSAILAVGIRPCSGALIVLVFALQLGLFWVGALSAFVMAIGTAITVSALSAFAVFARDSAVRLAGHSSARGALVAQIIGFSGAVLIALIGLVLFAASY